MHHHEHPHSEQLYLELHHPRKDSQSRNLTAQPDPFTGGYSGRSRWICCALLCLT